MCFGACEHQHGLPVSTSGVLIMRNLWQRAEAEMVRKLPDFLFRNGVAAEFNGCKLALEPEISGFATVCCAEVVQNGVRMSVRRLSVVTKFNGSGKLFC